MSDLEGFEKSPQGYIFKTYDGEKGNFAYPSFSHGKLESIRMIRYSDSENCRNLNELITSARSMYSEYWREVVKDFHFLFTLEATE